MAVRISGLTTAKIDFPIILLTVSHTPISRISGFLLRGISLHATKASIDRGSTNSVAILRLKAAKVLHNVDKNLITIITIITQ